MNDSRLTYHATDIESTYAVALDGEGIGVVWKETPNAWKARSRSGIRSLDRFPTRHEAALWCETANRIVAGKSGPIMSLAQRLKARRAKLAAEGASS